MRPRRKISEVITVRVETWRVGSSVVAINACAGQELCSKCWRWFSWDVSRVSRTRSIPDLDCRLLLLFVVVVVVVVSSLRRGLADKAE